MASPTLIAALAGASRPLNRRCWTLRQDDGSVRRTPHMLAFIGVLA